MSKKTNSGYVGFVLLAMFAIVLGGVAYATHRNNIPTLVFEKSENKTSNHMLLANVIETTLSTTTQNSAVSETSPAVDTTSKQPSAIVSVGQSPAKKNLVMSDGGEEVAPPAKPAPVQIAVAEQPTEPTLIVSSGMQPAPTLLLGYAARVPFTVIELTAAGGDVDIDSLTVERQGMGSDRIFTEVGVVDVDYERALNANHQYVSHAAFTIKNGETQEIVLFGNVADQTTLADYEDQQPRLALVGIQTTAKISGNLPVVGTAHKVNSSLEIGSYQTTRSSYDPGTNRNLVISDTDTTFSAVKLTASSAEAINLQLFGFTQFGSMGAGDIANIQICSIYKADTRCYPADVDGTYYYTDFGGNLTIDKGDSADVYIKGDILATAVNRTIDFDISSSYDTYGYGGTYKHFMYSYGGDDYGPQAEGGFSIDATPFYNAYAHTISGATAVYIGR